MQLFNSIKRMSEEELLQGKRGFAELWTYCKPIISNVSAKLSDPNRLQALESFSHLNEECNRHFNMNLRTVVYYFLQILERKSSVFSPGSFEVIDGDCRVLGIENKVEFFPPNMELQFSIISARTLVSPLMIQLVHGSPILSIYYSESGVEQSIPISGETR